MKFLIVSGLSGSGKTVALHVLEDLGYYCIDNLPIGMLPAFVDQMLGGGPPVAGFAAGIDARNLPRDLDRFPAILEDVRGKGLDCEIFYLTAADGVLLMRFSETRRKHPLTRDDISLSDAIAQERELLEPIAARADLVIDTTVTNVHQLRDLIQERVRGKDRRELSLMFESFGYKHGVPVDADFVFDARCIPNPHWQPELRSITGREQAVIDFLERQPQVAQMYQDIRRFLETWIPHFEADNRAYMTVAIGCTGGQHRSVYLVEQLARHFRAKGKHVLTRHRELP